MDSRYGRRCLLYGFKETDVILLKVEKNIRKTIMHFTIVGYLHCYAPAMVNYISVHTTVWDVWTYLQ